MKRLQSPNSVSCKIPQNYFWFCGIHTKYKGGNMELSLQVIYNSKGFISLTIKKLKGSCKVSYQGKICFFIENVTLAAALNDIKKRLEGEGL